MNQSITPIGPGFPTMSPFKASARSCFGSLFRGLGLAGLLVGLHPAAAETDGRILINPDGQPDFRAPAHWEFVARSKQGDRRILEYRFALSQSSGAKALARLSLRKIARSVRLADLTPQEAVDARRGSDAALGAMKKEIEGLPGMQFLSGGTQFDYTALEGDRRFHYVHFFAVTGVAIADSKMRSAIAIDLRCRNAVDEDSPNHLAAAEALEAICFDLMRNF